MSGAGRIADVRRRLQQATARLEWIGEQMRFRPGAADRYVEDRACAEADVLLLRQELRQLEAGGEAAE